MVPALNKPELAIDANLKIVSNNRVRDFGRCSRFASNNYVMSCGAGTSEHGKSLFPWSEFESES